MNAATPPVVVARGLERRFGQIVALRSVDFTVEAGEVVLLAGPNGAGKSTLLRCLAGLTRPSHGAVRIQNRQLRTDPAARSLVGFLSHQSLLYDDLTAQENLRFAAQLHGLDGVEQRVRDALDAAGLTQRAATRAGALSHGTRQRLAIARATLHAPALLLLDEPFSGLDALGSELLRGSIGAAVAGRRAIVCVTHQPAEIWMLATRVVLLDRGAVVADTPRPPVLDEFLAGYRRLFAA
ncbi:MAG: heme ABC exporter ATP-binding protein CcmA [Gemmatimonadales bacterium]